MIEKMNGTVMKVLAIVGVAGLAYFMMLVLAWLTQMAFDVTFDETAKTITSIIVLLVGATAGAKYATTHEVQKKEKDQ